MIDFKLDLRNEFSNRELLNQDDIDNFIIELLFDKFELFLFKFSSFELLSIINYIFNEKYLFELIDNQTKIILYLKY